MKTKEEYYSELLVKQSDERRNIHDLENLFKLAKEVEDYVKEYELGYARIEYYVGSKSLDITFYPDDGYHPIQEALILIDEIFYKYDWIMETSYPKSPIKDHYIYWTFKDASYEGVSLDFCLMLKKSGGCKQVGTGKFQEIMEWKCS